MIRITTLAALLLSSGASFAQERIETPPEALMTKVIPMFERQAQSIKFFTAPNDLIAIGIVTNDLKQQVFYTNQTGDMVLSGMMYDTNSKVNYNLGVISQLPIELPESLTTGIQDLPSVSHGDGQQIVYAIVDANCGYCKRFYQKVETKMATGQLKNVSVKYIPVGILAQDSQDKAEAIMSLPESERFTALQSAVNRQPINMTSSQEGKASVDTNESFMNQFAFISGVPLVLTNLNGEWLMERGLPKDSWFENLARASNPVLTTTSSPGM